MFFVSIQTWLFLVSGFCEYGLLVANFFEKWLQSFLKSGNTDGDALEQCCNSRRKNLGSGVGTLATAIFVKKLELVMVCLFYFILFKVKCKYQ